MKGYTYKDIKADADANAETDYNVAYARMSVQTVNEDKAEALVTEADVLSGLGTATGDSVLDLIEANVSARVTRLIQNKGINMADPESKAQVEALRAFIGDTAADWLLAQAVETKPKWPGLKPGHVQNALEGFGSKN